MMSRVLRVPGQRSEISQLVVIGYYSVVQSGARTQFVHVIREPADLEGPRFNQGFYIYADDLDKFALQWLLKEGLIQEFLAEEVPDADPGL